MSFSYWPKSAKNTVLVLIILLVIAVGLVYYLLITVKNPLAGPLGLDVGTGTAYSQIMPKTIIGKVTEINSSFIQVEASRVKDQILPNPELKKLKLTKDTIYRKGISTKLDNGQTFYKMENTTLSDFTKNDIVNIQADKDVDESDLSVVDIQLVNVSAE